MSEPKDKDVRKQDNGVFYEMYNAETGRWHRMYSESEQRLQIILSEFFEKFKTLL